MSERWVKFTSPLTSKKQWVNMAHVQHLTEREGGGTMITYTNDSCDVGSYSDAEEPPEHFL